MAGLMSKKAFRRTHEKFFEQAVYAAAAGPERDGAPKHTITPLEPCCCTFVPMCNHGVIYTRLNAFSTRVEAGDVVPRPRRRPAGPAP
jgi:hypothetical protein